jgi:Methyltransferase domain
MDVDATLSRLYLGEHGLRREDLKKARELAALLPEIERIGVRGVIVDAAAGHAYVGLLAVELLGAEKVVLLERDPARVARSQDAAARLSRPADIQVRRGELHDRSVWPAEPHLVAALHACGAASDDVIDSAVAVRSTWILLVPCCYLRADPAVEAAAERLGISRQAEVRRRFAQSVADSRRTLRLEAAGYEVTVTPFVAPTVTPHNLLWRCRRVGEPRRMQLAADQLSRLPT